MPRLWPHMCFLVYLSAISATKTTQRQFLDLKAEQFLNEQRPPSKLITDVPFREDLHISKIALNETLQIQGNVSRWSSLTVKSDKYVFGLMQNGIYIVQLSSNGELMKAEVAGFPGQLTDLTAATVWNRQNKRPDVYLVVACNRKDPLENSSKIIWAKINSELTVEIVWQWEFHQIIKFLKVFDDPSKKNGQFLMVGLDENQKKDVDEREMEQIIELYQYLFDEREYWLLHHLPINFHVDEHLLSISNQIYFSLANYVQNYVQIYHLELDTYKLQPTNRIIQPKINVIESFTLNYQNYLIIGGENEFKLFKVNGKTGISQIGENESTGNVTAITSMYLDTYTSKIVIFIEHELDFDTHSSKIIDAFVFDGVTLTAHDDVDCVYFGEKSQGFQCLLHDLTDSGLTGTAHVLIDDRKSLLFVPRVNQTEVFTMAVERIKKIHNNFNGYLNAKNEILRLSQMQDSIFNALNQSVQPGNVDHSRNFERLSNLLAVQNKNDEWKRLMTAFNRLLADFEAIKLSLDEFNNANSPFSGVIVDEIDAQPLEIDNLNVHSINGHVFNDVYNDCVRKDDLGNQIVNTLRFSNINVNELNVKFIDGMDADEIVYNSQTTPIHVAGDLTFLWPVKIKNNVVLRANGTVNGLNFRRDVFQVNRTFDRLSIDSLALGESIEIDDKLNDLMVPSSLKPILARVDTLTGMFNRALDVDNLEVYGSVSVGTINGINFEEFLNSIYMKNVANSIDSLIVDNVRVRESDLGWLNGLKFPDEFVLSNKGQFQVISGRKSFNTTLITNDVSVTNTLNGLKPSRLITLTTPQVIPNNVTFKDLEVTESITIHGEILGDDLNKYSPNPTLRESANIHASVIFTKLNVTGRIYVETNDDGDFWDEIDDVVYKDAPEIEIKSRKTFNELYVPEGLEVWTNQINGVDVDGVPRKSDPVINCSTLIGFVILEDVTLGGLYDGVNVTDLSAKAIRLDRNETIDMLVFDAFNQNLPNVIAGDVTVERQLNFLEPTYLDGGFGDLEIDSLVVEHLGGPFERSSIDPFAMQIDRGNVPSDRNIPRNGTIKYLNVDTINGRAIDDLKKINRVYEWDPNNEQIDELHLNGPVNIKNINGYNLNDLLQSINAKLPAEIRHLQVSNVTFTNLKIQNWNDVDLYTFVDDFIQRDDERPFLSGRKLFKRLNVVDYAQVKQINGQQVEDLWTIDTGALVVPLVVNGTVTVDNCIVDGQLNDVNMRVIDGFHVDVDDNQREVFVLNGDFTIETNSIDELSTNSVNQVQLSNYFDNVVYTNQDATITGNVTFTNDVQMENVGVFGTFNTRSFPDLWKNMILLSDLNGKIINSSVVFDGNVSIEQKLIVNGNLDVSKLNGVDFAALIRRVIPLNGTISVNDPITFQSVNLISDVTINYINDIPFDNFLTIRHAQSLNGTLNVRDVLLTNDLFANVINHRNITREYENTILKSDKTIEIHSPVDFREPITTENMNVNDINGKKIDQYFFTIEHDQTLRGAYVISQAIFDNLTVNGSNVDFTRISHDAVRLFTTSDLIQVIEGNWTINGHAHFDRITGNGSVEDFNPKLFVETRAKINDRLNNARETCRSDYKSYCLEAARLGQSTRTQLSIFEYFQAQQQLIGSSRITSIFHVTFDASGSNYLLVSRENCSTEVFEWNVTTTAFDLIQTIRTKPIVEWALIKTGKSDSVYLASRSSNWVGGSCDGLKNTVIWRMVDGLGVVRVMDVDANVYEMMESSTILSLYVLVDNALDTAAVEYRLNETRLGGLDVEEIHRWVVSATDLHFVREIPAIGVSVTDGVYLHRLLFNINNGTKTSAINLLSAPLQEYLSLNASRLINGELKLTQLLELDISNRVENRSYVLITTSELGASGRNFDYIKMYANVRNKKLVDRILTNKPSSLRAMRFENGETFLVFIENEKRVKVYEYKGLVGFRERMSIKIPATFLETMRMPDEENRLSDYLVIVDHDRVKLLKAVMNGRQSSVNSQLDCDAL